MRHAWSKKRLFYFNAFLYTLHLFSAFNTILGQFNSNMKIDFILCKSKKVVFLLKSNPPPPQNNEKCDIILNRL